jgi:hypothetical protein
VELDLIWAALGISAIVGVVFFTLAKHWQRVLKQQSWAIRRLTERVRDLEEMADPEFLRRLNESTPSPLEEVYTFSFRLDDAFWRETLRLGEERIGHVRAMGSVPASVKIERWRGHMVARITEVLPESKSAGWQSRTLDVYPEKASKNEPVVLWEMPLAPAEGLEEPPCLQLLLDEETLKLAAQWYAGTKSDGPIGGTSDGSMVFLRVPLDATRLGEFRSHDPLRPEGNGSGNGNAGASAGATTTEIGPWQAFYSHEDEDLGLQWQMWIRDLRKKAQWDRWKILESSPVSVSTPNS